MRIGPATRLSPHVMGVYEEGDGIAAWAGELR